MPLDFASVVGSYGGKHRGNREEQDEGHVYGKQGRGVAPLEPKQKDGIYWGYQTRVADSISAVFTDSPFPAGE